MLNKKEMEKFASQYIKGRVKLHKNPKIYGKSDSYSCLKNNVFILFENKSITVKLSKTETVVESFDTTSNTLLNYLSRLTKFIYVENKLRCGDYDRPLNGEFDSEIIFQVVNKNIKKDAINFKFYLDYEERQNISYFSNNYSFPYVDFFLSHRRYEEVFLKIGKNKSISGGLRILNNEVVQEVLDFNLILDDVFEDQLNTLEMALL